MKFPLTKGVKHIYEYKETQDEETLFWRGSYTSGRDVNKSSVWIKGQCWENNEMVQHRAFQDGELVHAANVHLSSFHFEFLYNSDAIAGCLL